MFVLNTRNNTRHNVQTLANKYGKGYLTHLIKLGRFKPLPLTKNDAKNEGFQDKAIERMFGGSCQSFRPLSDFRKDTGRLKKGVKVPLTSFLSKIREKPRNNFTSNQMDALKVIQNSTQRRIEKMQKKQIMNLAKLAQNNLYTNSITFNDITDPYIIPSNWAKGRRNVYAKNTLSQLRKGNGVTHEIFTRRELIDGLNVPNSLLSQRSVHSRNTILDVLNSYPNMAQFRIPLVGVFSNTIESPYTREKISFRNTMPLKKYLNMNYKGKSDYLKRYFKQPEVVSKEIANLFQPHN